MRLYCSTEIALRTQQCLFPSCCSAALQPGQKALKRVTRDISILKKKQVNLSLLLCCLWLMCVCVWGGYFCKTLTDKQDKLAVTWLSWWCHKSTVFNRIIFWSQILRKEDVLSMHSPFPPMSVSCLSYTFSLGKEGIDNSFMWGTWEDCGYSDTKEREVFLRADT